MYTVVSCVLEVCVYVYKYHVHVLCKFAVIACTSNNYCYFVVSVDIDIH